MSEHRGSSFCNSCVKVPVDPYSRQPTPSYERPDFGKSEKSNSASKGRKISFVKTSRSINSDLESPSPSDPLDSFLEFFESIPDYGQVHHLSNEQFQQKVNYLKRKQKLFLQNLRNTSADPEYDSNSLHDGTVSKYSETQKKLDKDLMDGFKVEGKKCYFEESRTCSPLLYPAEEFAEFEEDEDFPTYKYKESNKDVKKREERRGTPSTKVNDMWEGSKENKDDSDRSDAESIGTKSLPGTGVGKDWHPTVPKPFSFTLREDAEKYMTRVEKEVVEHKDLVSTNASSPKWKKRRMRPVPLTSKIPLYEKLLAEKEERSVESLIKSQKKRKLKQVRPFRLECDRRAWRSLVRSSPELSGKSSRGHFKANPVPKNLFNTEIYDRMLEDEYYRHLKKKIRAAELMKSSTLPPSMARRERLKSASETFRRFEEPNDSPVSMNDAAERLKTTTRPVSRSRLCSRGSSLSTSSFGRSRSAMSLLPSSGNNLASILRCQASREKLEREIQQRMEEKRRAQEMKQRELMIGRKPVWRALRSAARYEGSALANRPDDQSIHTTTYSPYSPSLPVSDARHEHETDLQIRASLRRDEAREQCERHRLQMEMMLDRVTRIPTLFQRHSQSFQSLNTTPDTSSSRATRRKKGKTRRSKFSSADSYLMKSLANGSRLSSGSPTSSSDTVRSLPLSPKSSNASVVCSSEKSAAKSENSSTKKKSDRGQLKVSINETAELIEDLQDSEDTTASSQCQEK